MSGVDDRHSDKSGSHDTHDCQRYLSSLSAYVDGELSEALCHEIEAHMAECENCQIVVNTLTKTVELYHHLPEPEVPHDVKQRLYKVLALEPFTLPPAADSSAD
jgi:anti-sigma factor RsiW